MEMMANYGNLESTDLAQRKMNLKIHHQKHLNDFDKETATMLEEVEKRSIPSLEVTHAHKRLALREKQLNELAGSMKDLINKEELVKQYAEQAEKASEAAEEFRKRAMFDMANKIEQIKNERQLQSEEQRIAMEEELRQLELQLEKERQEEVLREAEKETERLVDIKRKHQARDDAEKVCIWVCGCTMYIMYL